MSPSVLSFLDVASSNHLSLSLLNLNRDGYDSRVQESFGEADADFSVASSMQSRPLRRSASFVRSASKAVDTGDETQSSLLKVNNNSRNSSKQPVSSLKCSPRRELASLSAKGREQDSSGGI